MILPQIGQSFLGGALIGLAVAIHFLLAGRVSGVSGITAGALFGSGTERRWRIFFIAGLISAGFLFQFLSGPLPVQLQTQGWTLWVAGLLVGFGSRMANGCTSGHGVCGISRFSRRSLIATGTFIAVGILTVWLRRLAGGL